MVIGELLVEIWGITCVGAERVECNLSFRECPKTQTKTKELTANAMAVNPWQQQAKDGGGRVVIEELLVEIWGVTCVGAEKVDCN